MHGASLKFRRATDTLYKRALAGSACFRRFERQRGFHVSVIMHSISIALVAASAAASAAAPAFVVIVAHRAQTFFI